MEKIRLLEIQVNPVKPTVSTAKNIIEKKPTNGNVLNRGLTKNLKTQASTTSKSNKRLPTTTSVKSVKSIKK